MIVKIQTRTDYRVICPNDVKTDTRFTGQMSRHKLFSGQRVVNRERSESRTVTPIKRNCVLSPAEPFQNLIG